MSRGRVAYGLLGAVAAATATGAAASGLIMRQRRRAGHTDPPQRFDDLDPDRSTTVQTDDGVVLYVEEVGPPDAPLTVVFAHGFTLSMRAFYFQQAAVRKSFGDDVRMVFYDQRGHGRSGPSEAAAATIEQLGRDLYQVLDRLVPSGPIVLVGHSMGGMTVLAMAEQHSELFLTAGSGRSRRRPRIVGVALICTSAKGLAGASLGLPALIARLRGPLAPLLLRSARRQAALVERGRRIGRDLAWVITRRFSFASPEVHPEVVDFLNELISATRIEAIADFYPALMSFDVTSGAAALFDTNVLIIGADQDVMTPIENSWDLADALPRAQFVELEGTGHVAILEAPDAVDEPLLELIARARDQ